jgi:protocatechuate 3,4-dioxygenase beta subunit
MTHFQVTSSAALLAALCAGVLPAQPPREGQSGLRVRALTPDGAATTAVYLNLWRAIDPAAKDTRTDRGLYAEVYWDDRATGRTWERFRNWSPGSPPRDTLGFDGLPAGEYRVSAATHDRSPTPDPTPFGISQVVRLGERDDREVTVRLSGDAPLTVRVAEVGSDAPLQTMAVRLVRADGLPVVHGHGSGNFFERTDDRGEVRFRRLEPGDYTLYVLGRRAWSYGEMDFEPPERPVPIKVESGRDNRADVRLRGRPLSQAEIDQRWPFVVTGVVRDDAGRPIPGAEIVVSTGVGTLFQSGHATSGPDGRYTLRFHPALYTRGGTAVVAAVVHARRPGYYERDLCRHGQLTAGNPPPEGDGQRNGTGDRTVIRPATPHTLNFVMRPATVVEGRLLDRDGRPISGRQVWATAQFLSQSRALASAETDKQGRFRFTDVPPGSCWFGIRHEMNDLRTDEVTLQRPDVYRVELVLEPRTQGEHRLTASIHPAP